MNELVSIITPTYNSEKFISATIQSIQNQSYSFWELLIIDDGSTDKTIEIISQFSKADPRIKTILLEQNQGTGIARNTGVTQANGRFIAFLDADDLWRPNKLERQLAFMKNNDLPFTFSYYDCIDEEGMSLRKRIEAKKKLGYLQLFFCNYIGNSTAIYDTTIFGKIPIEKSRQRQDWMLWLTILKKIKNAQPTPESLAYYRVRKNSISSSKMQLVQSNFQVYKQFHKKNYLTSLFCLLIFLFSQFIIKPLYVKRVKA